MANLPGREHDHPSIILYLFRILGIKTIERKAVHVSGERTCAQRMVPQALGTFGTGAGNCLLQRGEISIEQWERFRSPTGSLISLRCSVQGFANSADERLKGIDKPRSQHLGNLWPFRHLLIPCQAS
jgi:hypothetical protein